MLLALLCGAQFVAVLDTTIVAVALPDIQRDLGFDASGLQWVVTAYTLAFGGLLIPSGRAGDLLGRRRLFVAGLAVFTAASAGCGLAPTPQSLILLRAVQGAGCALMTPAALALLTSLPTGTRALGAWTAAAAGGGASGWVLGGILTEHLGWEAIFFVNVPLGVTAIALAPRLLPRDRTARHAARTSLDLPGSAAITGALTATVLGATQSPAWLVPTALLLAAFVQRERRAQDPLLPFHVLTNRPFVTANLVAAALTAATTPAMLLSILHQQQTLHRSATETGLACLPFNAAVIAGSLIGVRRMGLGLLGVAAGALLLVTGAFTAAYVVMGLGLGIASVASTAAGTEALPDRPGLASGLLNSSAQVGTVLGVGAIVGGGLGYPAAALTALAGTAALVSPRSLPGLRAAGPSPRRPRA